LFVGDQGEFKAKDGPVSIELNKALHKTIKKVTEDIEAMSYNTAISAMMEFVNLCYKDPHVSKEASDAFLLILSPFAPHIAEELWHRAGHEQTLAYETWPKFDPALVVSDTMVVSVQVNGKLRGTLEVSKTAAQADVIAEAKALEGVQRNIEGKPIKKEIYVPGKIVNFVV
jgi:leucyl-tRNA synthetase